ncbi:MAG: hypothetical protein HYW85_02690 [Deltaproteobacteria bacterium]|nr:hypothetical protein [Deltaproteobacteria bacterium]
MIKNRKTVLVIFLFLGILVLGVYVYRFQSFDKEKFFIVAEAGRCFSDFYKNNPGRLIPRIKEVIPKLNRSEQYAPDKLTYNQRLPMPQDLLQEFCNAGDTQRLNVNNEAFCDGYLYVYSKYYRDDRDVVYPKKIGGIECSLTVRCGVSKREYEVFKKSFDQSVKEKFSPQMAMEPIFTAEDLEIPKQCVTEYNGNKLKFPSPVQLSK